ncbi:2-hydroxyacid dehydrogenase [Boseongicola aestuarii]|uniref:Glycerate dehydrogenase n=1 Tax=Boseongicola aestuarii TaxID=1470561 RepID=A0A238J2Z5_9RHOB|nr:D-glycerate dehydrogenase [Boseongicola aestuarii]SMX24602.1 Glycerate dehydrogenase [Boseongicola aestuarii]
MKRLLITRPLPDAVLAAVDAGFDVDVRRETLPLTPSEMTDALGKYDAILPTLGDPLSDEVIREASDTKCKILANFGVGYNHINVAAAREAGMLVTNTPGAVTDATADIAMTLMLMTCRRAGEGERSVRAGTWEGWHPTQLLGMHVTGKTIGIVGMGRIGKAIAKRAGLGFDMDVVFFNRSKVSDFGVPARQLETLAEVCSTADVIVLAVPATPETRHLVNADLLAKMQPHSVLVNIARGDVIDEAALIAALQAGRIAGAGLDVYEREPIVPDALKALENVTLFPHLGTAALEVRIDMGLMAVANLNAWIASETPPNSLG